MCVELEEAVVRSAEDDVDRLGKRELGHRLRVLRECIDLLEADFSRTLARFDEQRGYELDGAVDSVAWLRNNARLTSGAAAERVNVAQKLDGLGATQEALTRGEIGFAHAAVIARAVDDVSPEAAPQMETLALEVAKGTDPSSLRHFTRQARACSTRWDCSTTPTGRMKGAASASTRTGMGSSSSMGCWTPRVA